MRKSVPFILTVVVSVLCTATLVRAAGSSGGVPLEASSLAASQVIGSGLTLTKCNTSPDNAAEWTKFAGCMTGNMNKIQKWGKTLDSCFQVFKVATRSDDVYVDPTDPDPDNPTTFDRGDGLVPAGGGAFEYYVGWKKGALNCPVVAP